MGVVASACDAAMPQSRPQGRRAAYWWTEEIAELRASSVHARRLLKRARRSRDAARTDAAVEGYRTAKAALRTAIAEAKARAWQELIFSLEEDPWGRPYKMVMGKLRFWEALEHHVLGQG